MTADDFHAAVEADALIELELNRKLARREHWQWRWFHFKRIAYRVGAVAVVAILVQGMIMWFAALWEFEKIVLTWLGVINW